MSDLFGKLKSGAGKVAFEADKMARLNRAQGEAGLVKKQMEALYLKLGQTVYHQYVSQEAESPDFAETCQKISELEQQLGEKEKEVQRINAEAFSPQAAATPAASTPAAASPVQPAPAPQPSAPPAAQPQTKFCPNCGKEMVATVKFCPDCGTKMS